MLTASDIIDRLGGASKVAEALDSPLTTVASWGATNFIPRWWHQPLLALAAKLGEPLGTGDFPTADKRIPRPKKADSEQASAA